MRNPYEAPSASITSVKATPSRWRWVSVPIGVLLLVCGVGIEIGAYLSMVYDDALLFASFLAGYGLLCFLSGVLLLLGRRRACLALSLFAVSTMAWTAWGWADADPIGATCSVLTAIGFYVMSRLMLREGALR